MTYADDREWSEWFTRAHLIPFLRQREAELPFSGLRVTQDITGWLARELDVVAKADAVAQRGGGMCLVAIRCSHSTEKDVRTFTVRYPEEYQGHLRSISDPSIAGAAYMIHCYAAGRDGGLLAAWVAETRDVVGEIESKRVSGGHEHPMLKVARSDGQPFTWISGMAAGAIRLTPDDTRWVMPSLFEGVGV